MHAQTDMSCPQLPEDTPIQALLCLIAPAMLLLCLGSDTIIVGHINLSCYLLTYLLMNSDHEPKTRSF